MSEPRLKNPLIIWTLQRTGGTNLSKFLNRISDYKKTQDEPFNGRRQFGHITKAWRQEKDDAALKVAMADVLDAQWNIKHCVERVPFLVSKALAEASLTTDYQHLFLYRINPVGRLLSMEYAERTRVWGPGHEVAENDDWAFEKPLDVEAMVEHEKTCNRRLNRIWRFLTDARKSPAAISFEELYSMDLQASERGVQRALAGIGIPLEAAQLSRIVNNLRSKGDQKTADRYARFQRRDELEARISDVQPLLFRVQTDAADPAASDL